MGLDMYAYRVAANAVVNDFEYDDALPPNEFFYWRKHHDLHGWMEELYRAKGGDKEFNCVPLRLTFDDLLALEDAVLNNTLPKTTGFFFGNNPPDDITKAEDLNFIAEAKYAIYKGYAVYYSSWW